jgi:hypothetical protein
MTTRSSTTPRGNDLFRQIQLPDSQAVWDVTYWDLWYLIILLTEYEGDWQAMIDQFRPGHVIGYARETTEAKFSHLTHLHQKLTQAGLTPEGVLGSDVAALLKREKRRAINNVLKKSPPDREKSEWMIQTPRKLGYEYALRGRWDRFAVSPERYASPMIDLFKTKGYYGEDESFALERKLSRFMDKREEKASVPEMAALYRAFLTVMLEQMDMVDDSYGVIGDLYGSVFTGYVGLPRAEIGLSATDFLHDILELTLWEDYGFLMYETAPFMAGLTPAEADVSESFLQTRWPELAELDLNYQSESALTLLGLLVTEQAQFDKFVPLAEVMGTAAWQRITRMAEKAQQADNLALATSVYEAALTIPGMHQDYIQKKYAELDSNGNSTAQR